MSEIGKLLGLLALGQQFADRTSIRRMVSGLAVLLVLLVVTGLIIGTVIVSGLYACYLLLLAHGLPPLQSFALTLIFTVCILAILLLAMATHARRTINIPKLAYHFEHSVLARLSPVVDSFLDGLLTRPGEENKDEHSTTR